MADFNSAPTSPLELQIQQQSLDRARALALILQKDSMQSPEGQMVSGHYIAPSITQYAGKMAGGLMAANQQASLDEKQLGLARQYNDYQTALADALINGGRNVSPPINSAVDAPSMKLGSGMYGIGDITSQPGGKVGQISNGDSPTGMGNGPALTAPATNGGSPLFKNMSPQILGAFLQSPDSAFGKVAQTQIQANAKALEPTEIVKNMRAAGIPEGSALWNRMLQQNLYKSNYIAPESHRAGSFAADPLTGSAKFFPQVPEGFQAVEDGQGGWKIVPVAGGSDAIAESNGAKKRGEAGYSLQKVWNDKTGQYEYTTVANVANGAGAQGSRYLGQDLIEQLPENIRIGILNSAKTGDGKFQLNYQLPNGRRVSGWVDLNSTADGGGRGTPFTAEPAPGVAAGATTMAEGNAKEYQALKTQAAGASDRINALDNILELANGKTQYGPGTSARIEKLTRINSFLPTQIGQLGNDDTKNAQIMQKYVSNLAGQYMKALGGTGSDAQLANSLKSIANPDMMNDAIKEVVPKLKALEAAVQAKANAYDSWLTKGNNVSNGHLFESQFRKAYDPRIFQLQQLSPAEQASYVAKLPPTEAKALNLKLKTLKDMGAL